MFSEMPGSATRTTGPAGLVLFGATGDLARKKLFPAVYDLANRGLLPQEFSLVGFGRRDWNDADFARTVRDAVQEYSRTGFREHVWQRLAEGIRFVPGAFDDDAAFSRLHDVLADLDARRGTRGNFALYLSVPPTYFPALVRQLKKHGIADPPAGSWRRAVIEKPFGHDLKSAEDLNHTVHEAFASGSVYRIDHYLGKETVQNILTLRFANAAFEPLWNRRHIDHVQITMAEDIGIGSRGGYYDAVGAARDIIQNHLLQLMALVAAERPAVLDAASLAAEKLQVLKAVRVPADVARSTARGQYTHGQQDDRNVVGYLAEAGVARDSVTETYAAVRLEIDNARWEGVPFYLRAGKRLRRRTAEIAVVFRMPPHRDPDTSRAQSPVQNALVIRIQPDEGMSLSIGAKVPGSAEVQNVSMHFAYEKSFTQASPSAYERLLLDVLLGDPSLFPHAEEIEESWRIIDPIERHWRRSGAPQPYEPGSWGPAAADEMLAREGRSWRQPEDLLHGSPSEIRNAVSCPHA